MKRPPLLAKSLFALLLIAGASNLTGCSVQSLSGPNFDATETEEAAMMPQQAKAGETPLDPNREITPIEGEEANKNGGTTGRPRILHNRSDR